MPRIDPAHLDMLRSKADKAVTEWQAVVAEAKAHNERERAAFKAAANARQAMWDYVAEFTKVEDPQFMR